MPDNVTLREANNLAISQQSLQLLFSQLSYSPKTKVNSKKSNNKPILNDICGSFSAGRLTAIVGPSGAGKTTLLNVLSGFKVHGLSGQILFNGAPRELLSFRKMSSYIAQNFMMLSLLTVEETLRVSADLKLPTSTSKQLKQEILNDIIEILNLHSCRHTLVRDVSGGEHKRLSIGIELITNPPIMFFDEPTSGLDSVASYQVMCYLQRLAHDGRIVVCVVHQPSSRLMQLFDDILVLSHGEVLYCGTQSEMLDTFQAAGHTCPQYYNPGDFVLEISSESNNQRCGSLITQNKAKYDNTDSFTQKSVDEEAWFLEQPKQALADTQCIRPKEQVDFWFQLRVLLRRHTLAMSRNLISVQMRVVMHFVVGLLLGVVYWQVGNKAEKVISNVSCLFFIILYLFFGNIMPSILLCLEDSPVFIREYYNSWYSMWAYYISKVLADLPLQIVCPTIFISISYFMSGQPPELYRFGMCWAISVMSAFIGHFIGVVGGSLFSIQLAIFLVPSSSIPFLLFSGFFMRMRDLSFFLRPICDISFFRYIFEGLMRAIYGYGRGNLQCDTEFCYFKSSEQFLKGFDMAGDAVSWDLLALAIFIFVLLIAFRLALAVCIRRAL
ncbi:hypothetical protein KR222_011626 [Zaprionus bogoriensis]|nr:hypothetical protein KR222_011626 [Zaprionus bogoriensis]